jgi:hypothetical protein
MTIHLTRDGSITLLDTWGHGRAPKSATWYCGRPATLIVDDGDGYYEAWAVEGSIKAAAEKAATFFRMGDTVAMLEGSTLTAVTVPDDFWLEDEDAGEFRPNLAKYPNAVGF